MVAERITPEAIAAERDRLDGEERLVVGQTVVTLGFTNAAVKTLAPREFETVAAYLLALLERSPLKASPAYEAHRIVLGALASELRGFAAAAGEPVGLEADLRAVSSQAEERRIRERLADQAAAFDRHVDDVLLSQAAQQAQAAAQDDDPYHVGFVISEADYVDRGFLSPDNVEENDAPDDEPTELSDDLAFL